tara:strand:- start:1101 stop:1202 length:102 start_codon:yes stop_codon:yes gene_type:complete
MASARRLLHRNGRLQQLVISERMQLKLRIAVSR